MTITNNARKLLLQVIEEIETHPGRFDMTTFGRTLSNQDQVERKKEFKRPFCHTVGCVAGHVVWIHDGKEALVEMVKGDTEWEVGLRAADILGLDDEQRDRLFYSGWEGSPYSMTSLTRDPTLVRHHVEVALRITLKKTDA